MAGADHTPMAAHASLEARSLLDDTLQVTEPLGGCVQTGRKLGKEPWVGQLSADASSNHEEKDHAAGGVMARRDQSWFTVISQAQELLRSP